MEKYKRIFVIVLDSLGIGEMPDAARFGDHDVDTFGHICDIVGTLNIPNLKKLGLLNLHPTKEMEEPYFGNQHILRSLKQHLRL